MRGRVAGALAVASFIALTCAQGASAHGLSARADLPLPGWLFGWAAAIVLTLSFVGLGILWKSPKLEGATPRAILRVPAWLEPLCGAIGVALFAGLLYAGWSGTQSPVENALPTFVYVFFWVVIPLKSALFGDIFRPFNPWRAIGRAAAWMVQRVIGERHAPLLRYPTTLGRWPAVITLVAFGWLELIANNKDHPQLLAGLAAGYACLQLVGMCLYGVETWTQRADGFSVYFGIFSRLSAFGVRDKQFVVRRPLSALTEIDWLPGTVALLCAGLGITAFDGGTAGSMWISFASSTQKELVKLGIESGLALQFISTVGLLVTILVVTGFYLLGIEGMRSIDKTRSPNELRRLFAHSLVPIALAYIVAHYFSMVVFQGQAIAYLISDPMGKGVDWFGTASIGIDYGVMSATSIWYLQAGALVVGHIGGLLLAHDRALAMYGHARDAVRSQYWMLVVMVGFTSLGLWLLSQANM